MTSAIETRLATLGLILPAAPKAAANYVPALLSGDLLFISGQLSRNDREAHLGTLGKTASIVDGQKAAQCAALNILAHAKAQLGSLDYIAQVLRLTGYVASTPEFTEHPLVINGASNLLYDVLLDAGKHTRAAVGVASLPFGCIVEIDAILKVR